MKYCPQCGAAMDDQATFCGHCGGKVVEAPAPQAPMPQRSLHAQQSPSVIAAHRNVPPNPIAVPPMPVEAPEPPKKKKRTGLIIGVIIGVILLLVGIAVGLLYLRWYQSPEQQLERALKEGDLEQAMELMQDHQELVQNGDATEQLKTQIASLRDQYYAGTIDCGAFEKALDEMEGLDSEALTEDIAQARVYAQQVDDSRRYMADGDGLFAAGDYAAAMERYAQIKAGEPEYENAQTKYTQARNAYRQELLSRGTALAAQGSYGEAIAHLEQALNAFPDDPELMAQLEACKQGNMAQQKQTMVKDAESYVNLRNYAQALDLLDDYLAQNDDSDISVLRDRYYEEYVQSYLRDAKKKADAGDYMAASALLDGGIKELPGESRLTDLRQQYRDAYAGEVVEQARALARENKFDEAFRLLDQAKKQVPENTDLASERKSLEGKRPVSLKNLSPVEDYRWNAQEARLEDGQGNEYYDSFNAYVPDHEGYGQFAIDGKYTRITGKVSSLWVQKRNSVLKIYADEELIYSSKTITPTTAAFAFDVDIPAGTKSIKLMCVSDQFHNSSILVMDVLLWP